MLIAYADPPYPGCAHLYEEQTEVDHAGLIARLDAVADGWALSTHTNALRDVLPLCPPRARVAAWVKPFASFKPGVNPAYAWEPVIFVPARKRPRTAPTVRDWVSASITLRRGLAGAKPRAFALWLFELLAAEPIDTLVDVFPGTGAIASAWLQWRSSFDTLWGEPACHAR